MGGAHQQQQHPYAHAHYSGPELHHLAGGAQCRHQRADRSSNGTLAYAGGHWSGPIYASGLPCQTHGPATPGTTTHSKQQRTHTAQRAGQAECQRCPGANVAAPERTTTGCYTTKIVLTVPTEQWHLIMLMTACTVWTQKHWIMGNPTLWMKVSCGSPVFEFVKARPWNEEFYVCTMNCLQG